MAKSSKTEDNAETSASPEILDLLPKIRLLPWEDETQYEALKSAVIDDLNPNSPHERVLAHRIADVYWEQSRNDVLFRDLSMATYRKAAVDLMKQDFALAIDDGKQISVADGLLSSDPDARANAIEVLSNSGITEQDIRGRAYLDHMQAMEALARRPSRLDERRRALLNEYYQLHMYSKIEMVDDAIVIS